MLIIKYIATETEFMAFHSLGILDLLICTFGSFTNQFFIKIYFAPTRCFMSYLVVLAAIVKYLLLEANLKKKSFDVTFSKKLCEQNIKNGTEPQRTKILLHDIKCRPT